jgi:hypothetical protein
MNWMKVWNDIRYTYNLSNIKQRSVSLFLLGSFNLL